MHGESLFEISLNFHPHFHPHVHLHPAKVYIPSPTCSTVDDSIDFPFTYSSSLMEVLVSRVLEVSI